MHINDMRKLLQYIHDNYDVESWRVGDIQIWPRIRVKLFEDLHHEEIFNKRNNDNCFVRKIHWRGIKNLFSTISEAIGIHFSNIGRKVPCREQIAIVGYHHLRNFRLPDGRYYNVYMDPIVDLCKYNNWEIKFFEHKVYNGKGLRIPEYSNIVLITLPLVVFRYFARLCNKLFIFKKKDIEISADYICFFNDMVQRGINPAFLYNKESLILYYYYVKMAKNYFKYKINKESCKLGLCVDAESDTMEAFLLACRECGIPTVEMQHGVIHYDHPAFAEFKCREGYNTLPDYFICWDEQSADIIRAWADRSCMHKVMVGGNLWHSFWLENKFFFKKEYVNRIIADMHKIVGNEQKKIILVSLQGDLCPPPIFMLETIEIMNDFFFVFRLHPSTSVKETERVRTYCEKHKNTIFDDGNCIPCIVWYSFITANITRSSTIIEECAWWGIPSISVDIHDNVCEKYKIQSERGFLQIAHDGEELRTLILNACKLPPLGANTIKQFTDCLYTIMERRSGMVK